MRTKFKHFNFVDFSEVENKEIEFILKDFLPIPKKAVTLLSAKGGVGKSWLVSQLALRAVKENQKVFLWSNEPDNVLKFRMDRINKVAGINEIDSNNIKTSRSWRPFDIVGNNILFTKLKQNLKDEGLIILDPLSPFFGGQEWDRVQVVEFMSLLRQWATVENKAIILTHNNNKQGGLRGEEFERSSAVHYRIQAPADESGNRTIKVEKDKYCEVIQKLGTDEIKVKLF